MTRLARVFCVSIAVFVVSGCGGGDDSPEKGICQTNCATKAMLKCPKDDPASCQAVCEATINAVPNCKPKFTALVTCTAAHPVSDWECGSNGQGDTKDGICDAEGLAAVACVLGGS